MLCKNTYGTNINKRVMSIRLFAATLVALLFLTTVAPVFGENSENALPLLFSTELVEDGEEPGIYGTLNYIPEGTKSISVMYSYNYRNFYTVKGATWDLTGFPEKDVPLTQLCIGTNQYPLTVYYPEGDSLYIKLHITIQDGYIDTEAVKVAVNITDQVPVFSAQLVADGENPGIYGTLSYMPEDTLGIDVMYSFGGKEYYLIEDSTSNPQWDNQLAQLCIGINEYPLTAYQSETVNSLYVKLHIYREGRELETEVVKFSHNKVYPIPDSPPPFTAKVELDPQGYYQVNGRFTDFPPNVARVRPMYSLNGKDYKIIEEANPKDWFLGNFGTDDPEKKRNLENQICIMSYEEPLRSYKAKKIDRFYMRLQITTEDGDSYNSEAALIERGAPQPLSQDTYVRATFPFTMRVIPEEVNRGGFYGQYQIVVREDATAEAVYGLLPDTLPMEVQILQKGTNKFLTSGSVECNVMWNELPSIKLTSGGAVTIQDAASELVAPAGSEVVTPLGIYILPDPLSFDQESLSDDVQLMLNPIGKEEKPDVSLSNSTWLNDGILSLAFRKKPSGATSIKAYSFVNAGDEWKEICDLLNQRDLNHNQAAELYGYVNILRPDESPLEDYLYGEIPEFKIGLIIEGGTFDGERVILPWPGDYDPPEEIVEPDSSEGNENNAGSGGGSEGGSDSGSNGGLYPGIPEEDKPPIETAPPPDDEGQSGHEDSSSQPAPLLPPHLVLPWVSDGGAGINLYPTLPNEKNPRTEILPFVPSLDYPGSETTLSQPEQSKRTSQQIIPDGGDKKGQRLQSKDYVEATQPPISGKPEQEDLSLVVPKDYKEAVSEEKPQENSKQNGIPKGIVTGLLITGVGGAIVVSKSKRR